MLSLEIKKIIKRREYVFFFFVMFLGVIFDFVINCYNCYGEALTELYPASVMTVLDNISRAPFRTVFVIFLPFISCIVASDTFLCDSQSGINNYILSRVSRKKYIKNKAIAIFCVVSLTIFFVLCISIILSCIAFPMYGYTQHGVLLPLELLDDTKHNQSLLWKLRIFEPYINLIIWAFVRSIIGGIFAILSYGISFIKGINRYVVLFSSFLIYNALSLVQNWGETYLISHKMYDTFIAEIVKGLGGGLLMLNPRMSLFSYILGIAILLVPAIIMIYIGTKKEEI